MSKNAKVVNEPNKEVAVRDERTVAGPVAVRPATLIDQGVEVSGVEGLPAEFQGGETLSGFPPSAKFEKRGDCIFGEYIGLRENVGPNNSRHYELSVPRGVGQEPMTVGVWGSAALDRLFDSAFPPVQQGDKVAMIYLGEKATKRGLNPVKLFALKVKRGANVETATAH
jgi:hypothetical protein